MTEKVNLDFLCAKHGQDIIRSIEQEVVDQKIKKNDIENMLQKSLGILQEDGIYAFTVYLDSEGAFKDKIDGKEKVVKAILKNAWNLLSSTDIALVKGVCEKENVYPELQRLSEDLNKLFLAKDLIERCLIYARYHTKALPGK